MKNYTSKLALVVTILLAAAGVGCSSYGDICDQTIQCIGGNDEDIDACVQQYEGNEDVASAYDCSDPFDKYIECVNDKIDCDDGKLDFDCGDEAESLQECISAASDIDD
jgi:hypothetical protein